MNQDLAIQEQDAANRAYSQYVAEVINGLRSRGFDVEIVSDASEWGQWGWFAPAEQVTISVSKGGVSSEQIIPRFTNSGAAVDTIAQVHSNYAGVNQGVYVPLYDAPVYTPITPVPGPGGTGVLVDPATLQVSQTPTVKDEGTFAVSGNAGAPATTQRYNWDEWNWIYEQETGRIGADPAMMGVQDRTALLTRNEWWNIAQSWYLQSGGGSAVNPPQPPPESGNGGGFIAYSLVAALLEMLGIAGGTA